HLEMAAEHVGQVTVARKSNRHCEVRERVALRERQQRGTQSQLRAVLVERKAREPTEHSRKVECAGPDVMRELSEGEPLIRERGCKMFAGRVDEGLMLLP